MNDEKETQAIIFLEKQIETEFLSLKNCITMSMFETAKKKLEKIETLKKTILIISRANGYD